MSRCITALHIAPHSAIYSAGKSKDIITIIRTLKSIEVIFQYLFLCYTSDGTCDTDALEHLGIPGLVLQEWI